MDVLVRILALAVALVVLLTVVVERIRSRRWDEASRAALLRLRLIEMGAGWQPAGGRLRIVRMCYTQGRCIGPGEGKRKVK